MSEYIVYIIKCADNTLYTGITTDIDRRVKQHNGITVGGAKYTAHNRPVEVVYSEKHPDRSSASKREYEIKKMTKQNKLKLIQLK